MARGEKKAEEAGLLLTTDWVYCSVSRTVATFVTGMRSATCDRERAGFRDAVIRLASGHHILLPVVQQQSRVAGSLAARAWRAVCNRQWCLVCMDQPPQCWGDVHASIDKDTCKLQVSHLTEIPNSELKQR